VNRDIAEMRVVVGDRPIDWAGARGFMPEFFRVCGKPMMKGDG